MCIKIYATLVLAGRQLYLLESFLPLALCATSLLSTMVALRRSTLYALQYTSLIASGFVVNFALRSTFCEELKAGFRSSFDKHNCSGTASQVTAQQRQQHANASGSKVGFELATDGIQFYVFANFWSR